MEDYLQLADRFTAMSGFRFPADEDDLLRACRERGWVVIETPALQRRAYCYRGTAAEPVILLGRGWDRWHLAHEILHALTEHWTGYGVILSFSETVQERGEEHWAHMFAAYLCGPRPLRRSLSQRPRGRRRGPRTVTLHTSL